MDDYGDEERRQPITEAEVSSLAEKLGEWGNQLPQEERELLTLILARVAGTEPVEGEVILPHLPTGTIERLTIGALRPFVGTEHVQPRDAWLRDATPWVRWSSRIFI